MANAKTPGECAFSRAPIDRGEPVYRPKKRSGHPPANEGAMISAASLLGLGLTLERDKASLD